MKRLRLVRYQPDRRFAQLRFPRLDPEHALLLTSCLERCIDRLDLVVPRIRPADATWLVQSLERIVRAIWRAHGNAMADHLGMLGIDQPAAAHRPLPRIELLFPDDDLPF
jgi:hypothetical protein